MKKCGNKKKQLVMHVIDSNPFLTMVDINVVMPTCEQEHSNFSRNLTHLMHSTSHDKILDHHRTWVHHKHWDMNERTNRRKLAKLYDLERPILEDVQLNVDNLNLEMVDDCCVKLAESIVE